MVCTWLILEQCVWFGGATTRFVVVFGSFSFQSCQFWSFHVVFRFVCVLCTCIDLFVCLFCLLFFRGCLFCLTLLFCLTCLFVLSDLLVLSCVLVLFNQQVVPLIPLRLLYVFCLFSTLSPWGYKRHCPLHRTPAVIQEAWPFVSHPPL